MLRSEACMSSSRRTKSYSCHSVDQQYVSVNSSGPVNVAIATNTVLSKSPEKFLQKNTTLKKIKPLTNGSTREFRLEGPVFPNWCFAEPLGSANQCQGYREEFGKK
ncbi:Hypothetical protein CINCED_3A024470 [Cinara cedri]|uniref:Uncharacterized protein n=1 Tax=Cinara cedri TaxID=506608 RepID=A0A5E4NFV6_9HEMI|nr:Hypothetical protein CINCED_3A024470 [Cinara cedri]